MLRTCWSNFKTYTFVQQALPPHLHQNGHFNILYCTQHGAEQMNTRKEWLLHAFRNANDDPALLLFWVLSNFKISSIFLPRRGQGLKGPTCSAQTQYGCCTPCKPQFSQLTTTNFIVQMPKQISRTHKKPIMSFGLGLWEDGVQPS